MSVRVIANATLPVSRWHNGAGRKADVVAGEGWLISFAWLDADAPFSALPGTDRTITLVQGPGFTLDIAGRERLVVQAPFQPAAFDGGAPTTCRIAGPSRVLNVMTARDRVRHTVAITQLRRAEPAGLVRVAVLLRGSATVAKPSPSGRGVGGAAQGSAGASTWNGGGGEGTLPADSASLCAPSSFPSALSQGEDAQSSVNEIFTLAVLDAVQLDAVAHVEASADALWADITISRA